MERKEIMMAKIFFWILWIFSMDDICKKTNAKKTKILC